MTKCKLKNPYIYRYSVCPVRPRQLNVIPVAVTWGFPLVIDIDLAFLSKGGGYD